MSSLKQLLFFSFLVFNFQLTHAQGWKITEETPMPELVSNNAVCEGFVNDTAFVYSFTGIGAGKTHIDIHLKSWRYNTISKRWSTLPNVPDSMGKIATGASRVGDTIYIIGGYHVFPDNHEVSSSKVHRFDIKQNNFISDGTPCPIGIDDHVQCVYQDSLIYIITGWSNTGNVNNVYIYHPRSDEWESAMDLPNTSAFKSFGASGAILNDTIFFYGGAADGFGFPAQPFLRKGVINPTNPKEITWTASTPNNTNFAYRSACVNRHNQVHWLGGSMQTYNYNGLAYSNNLAVPNSKRNYELENGVLNYSFNSKLNMDYRCLAKINNDTLYLSGGMEAGAKVSSQLLKLTWDEQKIGIKKTKAQYFGFYPNPSKNKIYFSTPLIESVYITNLSGTKLLSIPKNAQSADLSQLSSGIYLMQNNSHISKLIINR